jgi:hypothetical protein
MSVTLFPSGVSNANIGGLGAGFPALDPTRVTSLFDDFYTIDAATGTTAAEWRVLGVTPVAPLVTAGPYGQLTFAPVGAVDTTYIQYAGNRAVAAGSLPLTWNFVAGFDVWFQTRFQISNANLSAINAGFFPAVAAAGDPSAVADGVFFTKASGTTTLSLKAIRTAVGNSTVAVATLADATFIKVGFHYNSSQNRIDAYVNDSRVASIPTTNMPTVSLIPLIGHGNNTAARTSIWDYMHAAQARQSEDNN